DVHPAPARPARRAPGRRRRRPAPGPAARPVHGAPQPARDPTHRRSRPMTRILLVEDEESYRDPLAYLLRKEGYDVSVAATGPDALAEYDRGGADLVLLDLMLPGLSGTEVCARRRQRGDVPIIMLTAKDTEVDKVVGLELGADDYVTKPYSSRELLARVRAVLRRRGEPVEADDVLVVGGLRLDADRHVVEVDGERVAFPLK